MRYRCNRSTCGPPPQGFEFEADGPVCPKCGISGTPHVHELTDVHFVVMGKGPLSGGFGACYIACEPDRPHLALHAHSGYAATDLPPAVTCPKCKGVPVYQQMLKDLFPTVWLQQQAKKTNVVVDLGAGRTADAPPAGDCGCAKKEGE